MNKRFIWNKVLSLSHEPKNVFVIARYSLQFANLSKKNIYFTFGSHFNKQHCTSAKEVSVPAELDHNF